MTCVPEWCPPDGKKPKDKANASFIFYFTVYNSK
jgi:hypothetical protein